MPSYKQVPRYSFFGAAMRFITCLLLVVCCVPAAWAGSSPAVAAQDAALDPCPRPLPGSAVAEPEDLRSRNGVLRLDLEIHNSRQPDGSSRYCYLLPDGNQAPTLRLHPGDQLILRLKNALVEDKSNAADLKALGKLSICTTRPTKKVDPCVSGVMTAISTNLHFHGLTIPPVCHQDEVLNTSIQPGDPPFEYRFRIPENEPPGLYWYHPHIHGFTKVSARRSFRRADCRRHRAREPGTQRDLPERVLPSATRIC